MLQPSLDIDNVPMRFVMVGNNKGGVAKSSSTKLLAEYLAIAGIRVLIIDLDPQCNISGRLIEMEADPRDPEGWIPPLHPDFEDPEARADDPNWQGRSSSADLFKGGTYIYPTRYEGIDLVPGHSSDLELIVQQTMHHEMDQRVVRVIAEWVADPLLAEHYDVVLIDTPPSRGPVVMAAVNAATDILIVTEMAKDSIVGVQTLMASIQYQNWGSRKDNPINILGIAATKLDRRSEDMMAYYDALLAHETIGPLMIDPPLYLHKQIRLSDDRDDPLQSVFELPPSRPPYKTAYGFCQSVTNKLFGLTDESKKPTILEEEIDA